jgi:hypothetical protein
MRRLIEDIICRAHPIHDGNIRRGKYFPVIARHKKTHKATETFPAQQSPGAPRTGMMGERAAERIAMKRHVRVFIPQNLRAHEPDIFVLRGIL